ncbi:MAG: hypothetical protein AAB875_06210 [Patescibacteria group bacterium]
MNKLNLLLLLYGLVVFLVGLLLGFMLWGAPRPAAGTYYPTPTATPTPQCELNSWSCGECQVAPFEQDICGEAKYEFCYEEFGCDFEYVYDENGDWDGTYQWVCEETCEQPSPSPSPTPEPTPEPTPTSQLTVAGPPICTGQPVTLAPLYDENDWSRADSDTIRVTWDLNDPHAQSYGIYYGMSRDNLTWFQGFPGHDTTWAELNLVPPGHVWGKICSIGACGDEKCGPIVDP